MSLLTKITLQISLALWLYPLSLFGHEGHGIENQGSFIEELLCERESLEKFEKLVIVARNHGITEQAILESRFLFHVDRDEDKQLVELLPQFLESKDTFKVSDSAVFGSVDDWLATVEYILALDALQRGNPGGFEHHIKEAFWLSPRQGSAFATHVERIRLVEAMKLVKFKMGGLYHNLFDEPRLIPLNIDLNKKALLLHFWSPNSQECQVTMADFLDSKQQLLNQGLTVISVLPERSDDTISKAKVILEETKKKIPGQWAIDTAENDLCNQLRIKTVPTVVIITATGNVVFNGHPTDDEFWKQLNQLSPSIQRPDTLDSE